MIGSFRLWVFLDRADLRSVTVNVKRLIYINSRSPIPGLGKKVAKILPHGRAVYDLYQVELEEYKFLENNKDLSNALNHHDVEGSS